MKKNRYLTAGLVITGIFLAMAVLGHFWTPYRLTDMDFTAICAPPSASHLMGTDNIGRDVLSLVMKGSGTTFTVAIFTVLIGFVFGTVVGAVTGYYGGWLDNIVMRVNDILLSFPSILLALIIVSLIGGGTLNLILSLGILFIPSFARIVRSEVIRNRDTDFVRSARIMGVSEPRIIFAHILPNAWVSMLTSAAIGFNNAVLAESSMSYLGLGSSPMQPSLGMMLSNAQAYLFNAPWYAFFPGLVIILIILGFSFIAEGLRNQNR